MGKIYKVEIGFGIAKHCLDCPLMNQSDDSCRRQVDSEGNGMEFANWPEQMEGCPLKLVREVD